MKTKNNLSKEMEANIKNYANEIESIKEFAKIIRQTPGMYIGQIKNHGYLNMVREIYQNSIDEAERLSSPCDFICVTFDELTKYASVEDNGRGLPHGHIIRILTQDHTSSNYKKKPFDYSSGLHGVGAKVTNALSELFEAQSYILGKGKMAKFKEGQLITKGEEDLEPVEGKQGTKISFIPDATIMGEITVTVDEIRNLLWSILVLTKLGTRVQFKYTDKYGNYGEELLVNENGIKDILKQQLSNPVTEPIYVFKDTGELRAEFVIDYDYDAMSQPEQIISYANMCPTSGGGSHATGLVNGIVKFFRKYMNDIYLSSKSKLKIIPTDIKTGLKCVIHVAHLHPLFTGQAKDVLSNDDMAAFVESLCIECLEEWSKANVKELEKVCRMIKEVADIRTSSDESKVKFKKKYTSSSLNKGLPAKYKKPLGRKNNELLIVEGDSAGGGLTNTRHKPTQGLLPLKGKIPNALTTKPADFLNNAEVQAFIVILEAGYGKNFDISKCPFEKIIIMTDADVDGAHIRSLLLKMFLRYFKPLVEAGRIYIAVPPLYGTTIRGKKVYFQNNYEYVEYFQAQFNKNNKVTKANGEKITKSELAKLFSDNFDYTHFMESLADTYGVHPELLEFCLINKDLSDKDLKKAIKKNFRFIDMENVNGIRIVKGAFKDYINELFLDIVIAKEHDIMKLIRENREFYFDLNGEIVSLYVLMKKFESSRPNVQRFKGLGEMKPKELAATTALKENRTLIRVTTEDINAEFEKIKYYESNKAKILEGVKFTRKDLVM